eukprot:TRINITY_DN96823_c0_g1_i1.p1 TRINITY_DN96823_c0_g1~~TRINITY_DN96823_c0_g1_i1.p1  ORF type:complete len:142 (+),score=15.55 TRINITY_DN96823_c0_g1_i1:42-467(+)
MAAEGVDRLASSAAPWMMPRKSLQAELGSSSGRRSELEMPISTPVSPRLATWRSARADSLCLEGTSRSVPGMVAAKSGISEPGNPLLSTSIYDRDPLAPPFRRARDTCPDVLPAGGSRAGTKLWAVRGGVLGSEKRAVSRG